MGIVSAANYCCEQTNSGVWCQYTSSTNCNPDFQKASAYCEATSYCKTGTCINQQEGTCMPSTKAVCDVDGGVWSEKSKSELPQCKNGCCQIGNSVSFVTQTACNRMSSLYGLEINFQASINTELSCLANANPNVKGACVYTKDYVTKCGMTTKKECQDNAKKTTLSNVQFHEGYLCSAPELETICSKSQNTKCGEDDKVYFVDTCGNLANVYDSAKIKDENYWTKIQEPTCATENDLGNKNSPSCGDCDFYSGSMCREKKIGEAVDFGNYLCKDLDCKDYRGKYSNSPTGYATASIYPRHGESWCATDEKDGGTSLSPGATSFLLTCYNGEVNEPYECDETRQEVCEEIVVNPTTKFKTSNCKVNEWGDCIFQNKSSDCLNVDVRDCNWIKLKDSNGYYFSSDNYLKNDDDSSAPDGICVPKYQPGFTPNGEGGTPSCGLASTVCYVKMNKWWLSGAINKDNADWKCDDKNPGNNCSCLDNSWKQDMNDICVQMGDCGIKKNYIGELGYPTKSVQIKEGTAK